MLFLAEPMLHQHTNLLLFTSKERGVSQLFAQKVKSVTTVVWHDLSCKFKKLPFYPTHLNSKIHYFQYIFADKLGNEKRIFNKSRQYDMVFNFDFNVEQWSQLNEIKQIGYVRKLEHKGMPYVYFKDGPTRNDCLKPKDFEDLGFSTFLW